MYASKTLLKRESKKSGKHFDFFFSRTCFRYMNEFYKHKFSSFAAELEYSLPNLNVVSKSQMQVLLLDFLEFQFGIK